MGWILRILLFMLLITVVLRSAYRFLHGVIEGAGMDSRRVSQPAAHAGHRPHGEGPGVRHLRRAGPGLTASRGGQTAWFCSRECQRAWLSGKA